MNLIEIGKFLKETRKEKNLTQLELANKLNVSEKTISKWECGNGLPDTSIILNLCKELNISANELLSGKKLEEENYKVKAEENLLNLKQEKDKLTKFILSLEIVFSVIAILNLFVLLIIGSLSPIKLGFKIAIIVFAFIQFIVAMHFNMLIEKEAGYYECKHCKNKYVPSTNQMYCSMHIGRTRYMKCPKCKKRSWQHKVINKFDNE